MMAELLTLMSASGDTLSVDRHGAYITSLCTADGVDVLFVRTKIGEKLRGGIPVCAPIFGPGDSVGLAQHGFARDLGWEVVDAGANRLRLELTSAAFTALELPEQYRKLTMQLSIVLTSGQLELELTLKNGGDLPCVASPAFHPYFPTNDAMAVRVQCAGQEHSFTIDQLEQTQFMSAGDEPVRAYLDELAVTLESNEMQRYAVWSANPERYICVEPSTAGNLPAVLAPELLLAAGETRSYAMTLGWQAA